MSQELESIFAELGISQYLDTFVDQGFDTWETILDITESDLDALQVKLGHRRKLQRRIANSRGHAPDASLVSPTRASVEETKPETQRPDALRSDSKDGPVVTKRKYRRHPKPDENAPERPPSAYVLFSNKMRDELKGRNLTFTEIAKLVGEHWQNLSPGEKEPYETSALKAKEKYNNDLAEYKKTPEFRKYTAYLADFKSRQASANQAKESSKRQKLDTGGIRLQNGSASATPGSLSSTGSGSESQPGSEPPPTRKQRVGSVASVPESQFSTAVPTPVSQHPPADEPVHSPSSTQFDRESFHSTSPRASHYRHRRPTWTEIHHNPAETTAAPPPHLPPLADIGVPLNGISRSPEANGFGAYVPPRHPQVPLSLKHEYSSAGSSASSGSVPSYPQTPNTNPPSSNHQLPIRDLLQQADTFVGLSRNLQDQKPVFTPPLQGTFGSMNGYHSPPQLMRYQSNSSSSGTDGSLASSHASSHASSQTSLGSQERSDQFPDKMRALIQASEMVGRRP